MSVTAGTRDVIEQLDNRFQQRREQVPVLRQRAGAEQITRIGSREDMVPLLFPHTTYKSYPESLIARGKWSQMNRWIDSLSTYRVADVDGVEDVDDWIDRLEAAGHMGVQRLVELGSAMKGSMGGPHDGMYSLHRFVNWVVDDDA